jgi:hypothetical protein
MHLSNLLLRKGKGNTTFSSTTADTLITFLPDTQYHPQLLAPGIGAGVSVTSGPDRLVDKAHGATPQQTRDASPEERGVLQTPSHTIAVKPERQPPAVVIEQSKTLAEPGCQLGSVTGVKLTSLTTTAQRGDSERTLSGNDGCVAPAAHSVVRSSSQQAQVRHQQKPAAQESQLETQVVSSQSVLLRSLGDHSIATANAETCKISSSLQDKPILRSHPSQSAASQQRQSTNHSQKQGTTEVTKMKRDELLAALMQQGIDIQMATRALKSSLRAGVPAEKLFKDAMWRCQLVQQAQQ